MIRCDAVLEPSFVIAPVPRRLFGSFVEHMGRCVYGGIFDPGDPAADENGFRTDVMELTRELGVSVVRYPGGNFVSGYDWRDGVGPVAGSPGASRPGLALGRAEHVRPRRVHALERRRGLRADDGGQPRHQGHLRGLRAARVHQSSVRHGAVGPALDDTATADPYGIKLWCLGNEMDGPWQTGHKSAEDYGKLAAETAKAMRQVDPSIELVACGSSNDRMPTFGQWEATVLDHTFDHVDYLSLHAYFEQFDHDQEALPRVGGRHGLLHRRRRRDLRPHRGQAAVAASG